MKPKIQISCLNPPSSECTEIHHGLAWKSLTVETHNYRRWWISQIPSYTCNYHKITVGQEAVTAFGNRPNPSAQNSPPNMCHAFNYYRAQQTHAKVIVGRRSSFEWLQSHSVFTQRLFMQVTLRIVAFVKHAEITTLAEQARPCRTRQPNHHLQTIYSEGQW